MMQYVSVFPVLAASRLMTFKVLHLQTLHNVSRQNSTHHSEEMGLTSDYSIRNIKKQITREHPFLQSTIHALVNLAVSLNRSSKAAFLFQSK